MLKKTITFEDYNGQSVTEDFYFNLSKAELVELEVSEKNGLSEALKQIIAEEDPKSLIEQFKKIILMAVGKRSEDGRRFIKNQDIRDDFEQTNAFSELFLELATNAEAAAEFMRGIVPTGFDKNTETVELPETAAPVLESKGNSEKTWSDFTREELLTMPQEQFQALAGGDPHKMDRDLLVIAMQRKNAVQA